MALDPTYSQEYLDALPLWLKEAMNLSAPSVNQQLATPNLPVASPSYIKPPSGLFDQVGDSSLGEEDGFGNSVSVDNNDSFGIADSINDFTDDPLGALGFTSTPDNAHPDDVTVAQIDNAAIVGKALTSVFDVPTPLSLAVNGLFGLFSINAHNQANPQNYQQSFWDVLFGPKASVFHAKQRAARLGFTEESNPSISRSGIFAPWSHPFEADYRTARDPDSAVPGLVGHPYGIDQTNANNPDSPNFSVDAFDVMDINDPIDAFYSDEMDDESGFSGDGGSGGGGAPGGGGCFVAGSLIAMADGSTKPIEFIEVGDKVASFEDLDGPLIEGTVSEVAVDYVNVVNINDTLGVSHTEIMVTGDGNWSSVSDLVVGDTLLADTGNIVTIDSINHLPQKTMVFNFDVENTGTYTVDGYRTVRGRIVLGHKLMEGSPYPTMQIALSNFIKEGVRVDG